MRDGLIRVYETCSVCGRRFENVDGLGVACSSKCWKVIEAQEENEND